MTNRWARFRWPASFKGDPRVLGEQAGLVVRRDGNALRVTTVDQYYKGSGPRLVKAEHTVGEQSRQDSDWRQLLESWSGAVEPGPGLPPRVDAEVRRLLHHDDGGSVSTAEYFEAARLLFMCLPDEDLPEWIADTCLPTLGASMPGYRFCLVSYSDQIHSRMAFIRGLFAGENAHEWFADGKIDQGFGALRGLGGEGFQGGTRFIDPLLGAHAPWMYGTSLSRIRSGFAVVLFGSVLPGRLRTQDSGLIDTITTHHLTGGVRIRAPAAPTITTDDAEEAVCWWVRGLNRLMSHVLDLTLFTDVDGWYQPHQHLGHILSVERLFASVVSLLVHTGQDEFTRRMHMFEALDLMEGLSFGGYDRTVNLRVLQKDISQMQELLPAGPAQVVLPRCEAAVEALDNFQESFHPGRLVNGSISVTNKDGTPGTLEKDKATYRYIRLVRNAGHGFRKALDDPVSLSLLTAHEGNLPAAMSDLPYLHLVRLITDPDQARAPLLRRQDAAARRKP